MLASRITNTLLRMVRHDGAGAGRSDTIVGVSFEEFMGCTGFTSGDEPGSWEDTQTHTHIHIHTVSNSCTHARTQQQHTHTHTHTNTNHTGQAAAASLGGRSSARCGSPLSS